MQCLDEETVLTLLEGRLATERWSDVDHHIDECAACRRLLSTLAAEIVVDEELELLTGERRVDTPS